MYIFHIFIFIQFIIYKLLFNMLFLFRISRDSGKKILKIDQLDSDKVGISETI